MAFLSREQCFRLEDIWRANERRVFWLAVVLAILTVGGLIARQQWDYERQQSADAGMLVVNGERIPRETVIGTMGLLSGTAAVNMVVRQALIAQEARRLGITVKDSKINVPASLTDPRLRAMARQRTRTRLLLRKILLSQVSQKQARRVYRSFKGELTQRELVVVRAQQGKTVQATWRGTEPLLEWQFGLPAAAAVARLQPGQTTLPVTTPTGKVTFKLVWVHSDFASLEPAIDNILAESKKAALMHRLIVSARVVSPCLLDPTTPTPTASAGAADQ